MRKSHYLLFLLALLVSGCSFYQIDSHDTTLDFYPPKSSAEQVVYLDRIDRAHEVIGIVSVTAERQRPLEEIVDKMKTEAAILGGDAITDIRSSAMVPAKKAGGKDFLPRAAIRLQYVAKVVAFK